MIYLFVLVLSTCALIYEFLLSTLSSYLIGNSVLQFSLTIGFFLSGIGLGAFLSRFVKNGKVTFFYSEITLGIIGGFSTFLIKFLYIYFFNYSIIFYILYFLIVIFIGLLVGFEIPILGNIVSEKQDVDKKGFKNIISDVFTYDYIGAIVATFLFPFILLPYLGLTYTAITLGLFNLIVALLFLFDPIVKEYYVSQKTFFKHIIGIFSIIVLYIIGAFFIKQNFENFWDHFFYKEPIITKIQSKYQEIVITKRGNDVRLLLDGHLQFLSLDEKRYHEALWSLPKSILNKNKFSNILVLGGGDGVLARDIIESYGNSNNFHITLVDIDSEIINLAKTNKVLLDINKGSLLNKNITIVNKDAFKFLSEVDSKNNYFYDYIIADFTDPRDVGIAKLYSQEFYFMVKRVLSKNGIFVTQSGNAFFAKESFWCINKTLNLAFGGEYKVIPYKTYIPSFGDWGFNVVVNNSINLDNFYKNTLLVTKFDNDYLVNFEKIKINTIENPIIINYFKEGRKRFSL